MAKNSVNGGAAYHIMSREGKFTLGKDISRSALLMRITAKQKSGGAVQLPEFTGRSGIRYSDLINALADSEYENFVGYIDSFPLGELLDLLTLAKFLECEGTRKLFLRKILQRLAGKSAEEMTSLFHGAKPPLDKEQAARSLFHGAELPLENARLARAWFLGVDPPMPLPSDKARAARALVECFMRAYSPDAELTRSWLLAMLDSYGTLVDPRKITGTFDRSELAECIKSARWADMSEMAASIGGLRAMTPVLMMEHVEEANEDIQEDAKLAATLLKKLGVETATVGFKIQSWVAEIDKSEMVYRGGVEAAIKAEQAFETAHKSRVGRFLKSRDDMEDTTANAIAMHIDCALMALKRASRAGHTIDEHVRAKAVIKNSLEEIINCNQNALDLFSARYDRILGRAQFIARNLEWLSAGPLDGMRNCLHEFLRNPVRELVRILRESVRADTTHSPAVKRILSDIAARFDENSTPYAIRARTARMLFKYLMSYRKKSDDELLDALSAFGKGECKTDVQMFAESIRKHF